MQMQYSTIPEDAIKQIASNAGMLLSDFDPSDGSYDKADILGITSGGIQFQENVELIDYAEDMDNANKNTKEFMRINDRNATVSGTFVTMNEDLAERLMAASDNTNGHIVPRNTFDIEKDFRDIWYVTDYSDVNKSGTGTGAAQAGFIAIHMKNTLSTGGFGAQSADKNKTQFAFEFTAHYSADAGDEVPYDVTIKAGTPAST